MKHCNEIKGEVARVTRGMAEVTKGYQQQQQGSPGNSVTNASPIFSAKVRSSIGLFIQPCTDLIMTLLKHEKTLAKITATVEDIKRMAHGDTKTLSAMNTIIQGLKSSMATHEGKVSSMVKDQDAKVRLFNLTWP